MVLVGVLLEVVLKGSAGAAASEGLTGAGGSTSKMAHSWATGCWLEASVPQHEDLSTGCLSVLWYHS